MKIKLKITRDDWSSWYKVRYKTFLFYKDLEMFRTIEEAANFVKNFDPTCLFKIVEIKKKLLLMTT